MVEGYSNRLNRDKSFIKGISTFSLIALLLSIATFAYVEQQSSKNIIPITTSISATLPYCVIESVSHGMMRLGCYGLNMTYENRFVNITNDSFDMYDVQGRQRGLITNPPPIVIEVPR